MTKKNELLTKFKSNQSNFTFKDLVALLDSLGYEKLNTGKTGGSRYTYYNKEKDSIIKFHKPHPKKEFGVGTIKAIYAEMIRKGIIK